MELRKKLTTQEKALQINLNKAIYGSFAEIGAGQEVAANFFKVGGAIFLEAGCIPCPTFLSIDPRIHIAHILHK